MGFFDSVTSGLGAIGNYASDNSSWLKPLANVAYGAYAANQQDKANKRLIDYYKEQEELNYQQQKEKRDYELAMLAAGGAGGGGGGGGGRPSVSPEVLRDIMEQQLAKIREAQSLYKPYHEAGMRILPQMEQAYTSGVQGLNALGAATITPEKIANATSAAPKPMNANIRLPAHMRG